MLAMQIVFVEWIFEEWYLTACILLYLVLFAIKGIVFNCSISVPSPCFPEPQKAYKAIEVDTFSYSLS